MYIYIYTYICIYLIIYISNTWRGSSKKNNTTTFIGQLTESSVKVSLIDFRSGSCQTNSMRQCLHCGKRPQLMAKVTFYSYKMWLSKSGLVKTLLVLIGDLGEFNLSIPLCFLKQVCQILSINNNSFIAPPSNRCFRAFIKKVLLSFNSGFDHRLRCERFGLRKPIMFIHTSKT